VLAVKVAVRSSRRTDWSPYAQKEASKDADDNVLVQAVPVGVCEPDAHYFFFHRAVRAGVLKLLIET
jgi:hypothetical protein